MDMGNGHGMGVVGATGSVNGSGSGSGTKVGLGAVKGVPLDSGLATPAGELADPFEEFNSVTLHHDGEDGGGVQDHGGR